MADARIDAVDFALSLLRSRVEWKLRGLVEVDDLRQDLAAHVLANMKYYRPERGSLKTFVGMQFDQWWKRDIKARATRAGQEELHAEMPDAEWRPAGGDQELSPRAEAIIARLPVHLQETVTLHVALGAPLTAVAELTGAKYQTTATRARRARVALKEMAA